MGYCNGVKAIFGGIDSELLGDDKEHRHIPGEPPPQFQTSHLLRSSNLRRRPYKSQRLTQ